MKTIDFSKHDAHPNIVTVHEKKKKKYFEDRQYTFGKTFAYVISNQLQKKNVKGGRMIKIGAKYSQKKPCSIMVRFSLVSTA